MGRAEEKFLAVPRPTWVMHRGGIAGGRGKKGAGRGRARAVRTGNDRPLWIEPWPRTAAPWNERARDGTWGADGRRPSDPGVVRCAKNRPRSVRDFEKSFWAGPGGAETRGVAWAREVVLRPRVLV
jgi:hypothetical protein